MDRLSQAITIEAGAITDSVEALSRILPHTDEAPVHVLAAALLELRDLALRAEQVRANLEATAT